MNKIVKIGFGISIIIILVVLLYVGLIFGSFIYLGLVESAQDEMDWDYYGDDLNSNYMYNLELLVSSTPGITTMIDNVTIYIPVVSGKDNLSFSESFIVSVKNSRQWDCYFVETSNGTMLAVENRLPIRVSGKRNIVLRNHYETDYIIDTLDPIENALIMPNNSDNSSRSFSNIYVKYDISEEDAKVNFGVSVYGTNTWYNSHRKDSYSQHSHLTMIGSQDGWIKADHVMFAGGDRYPKVREIKGIES